MASLTKESFMELWRTKLLPSIRDEMKLELDGIKRDIKDLNEKCLQIEKSQEFMSVKYDQVIESIQTTKKQIDANATKIKQQVDSTSFIQDSIDELYSLVDEMQQYSRRECLEINGIPKLESDNVNQLVIEACTLIGVKVTDQDISTAHRLPDTRKVKDRIIVKFVRRDKKEEVYKNRRKLQKKTSKDIPSVARQLGEVKKPGKIHINESLTSYRRRLMGKINDYKKENNFKFLWTQNGKIFLKQSETSPKAYAFTTEEDFEAFISSS